MLDRRARTIAPDDRLARPAAPRRVCPTPASLRKENVGGSVHYGQQAFPVPMRKTAHRHPPIVRAKTCKNVQPPAPGIATALGRRSRAAGQGDRRGPGRHGACPDRLTARSVYPATSRSASRAASSVARMSSLPCAVETKVASNWEGAR